jgi:purine nucleosidase
MSDIVPLLFDTDIGSDIDDAVALAYLLRQPRCELLGITTVSGEPVERARLADAVCRAAGRDGVPIHSGIDVPLVVAPKQPAAPQKASLARWPHRQSFDAYTAVPFMREVIRSRPGEVTLLAVGPLTNVGVLFAMDPELPRLLRRLVLMGGSYTTTTAAAPQVEWNITNDPHAAAIVFRSPVPELVAVGLEVTTTCQLPAEECRTRMRGGPLDVVADMAEVWFEHRPQITFHDPLAAVLVFQPELCAYHGGYVEVELAGERAVGMTHWRADPGGPHRVAGAVRPDTFFEEYFSVVER